MNVLHQGPLYAQGDAKTIRVVTGAGEVDMPLSMLGDAMGAGDIMAQAVPGIVAPLIAQAIANLPDPVAAAQAAVAAANISTQIANAVAAAQPPLTVLDKVQTVVPASGQTLAATAGTTAMILNHSALIALLTVALPAGPADGQRWVVAAASGVTALTLTADKPVKGALTSIAAGGFARFLYSATAGAWFRVG